MFEKKGFLKATVSVSQFSLLVLYSFVSSAFGKE